ncbi:hypothetical protein BaRGS_00025659 [Batillaria attramentaria]|uniref:Uncharacterized protein n=1 Tax=Batillaria attramentaria TaxID=370345 RepID=A0ABD0K7U3_9CAEN
MCKTGVTCDGYHSRRLSRACDDWHGARTYKDFSTAATKLHEAELWKGAVSISILCGFARSDVDRQFLPLRQYLPSNPCHRDYIPHPIPAIETMSPASRIHRDCVSKPLWCQYGPVVKYLLCSCKTSDSGLS